MLLSKKLNFEYQKLNHNGKFHKNPACSFIENDHSERTRKSDLEACQQEPSDRTAQEEEKEKVRL